MTDLREDELALLDRRARALAQPPRLKRGVERGRDYLVFELDENRYALDVQFVHEVALAGEVLEVPHASSFLGVTALRGQFLAVVDLSGWLGAKGPSRKERRYIVACGEQRRELAILVDDVLELRSLELDHDVITGTRKVLLEDGLCVLHGRALLEDPRHFVEASDQAAGAHE